MPRPINPNAPSPADRKRKSRARRATRTLELPAAVLEMVEAVRTRDGDASLVACIERLVKEAAQTKTA